MAKKIWVRNLQRVLASPLTYTYLQGPAFLLCTWFILRYGFEISNSPGPLETMLFCVYWVGIVLLGNYRLISGQWSPSGWAKRLMIIAVPVGTYYAYFAHFFPEYFVVTAVVVSGSALLFLGLVKNRLGVIWIVAFLIQYVGFLYFLRFDFLVEHWLSVVLSIGALLLFALWMAQVSFIMRAQNERLSRSLAEVKKHRRDLAETHKKLAHQQSTIQWDLSLARKLQESILPDTDRFKENGLNIAAKYLSMERVGGDFYDILQDKEGRIGFYIADVSGHGIPAALVTTMTKASFNAHFLEAAGPALVMGSVNTSLCHFLRDYERFVSAFFCTYDPLKKDLEYSAGGHHPALLLRDKGILELDTDNTFYLGIEAARTYGLASIRLKKGDKLLLYTDGLTEARDPKGTFFGESRFNDTLLRLTDADPSFIVDHLLQELGAFTENAPQTDDIALMVIEIL